MSHYYFIKSKESEIDKVNTIHNANLRTYALQAAEKVNNLSNELAKLSTFLRDYLQNPHEEDSRDVVLRVKEERIGSVIHIVEMLRSVNETSLSDWRSVIGDELDRKRLDEAKIDIENKKILSDILDKIDDLSGDRNENSKDIMVTKELERFGQIISKMSESNSWHSRESGASGLQRPTRNNYALASCPECGNQIKVRLNSSMIVKIKAVTCQVCKTKLVTSQRNNGEPELLLREKKKEIVPCPQCNTANDCYLDNVIGATTEKKCNECHFSFRLSRSQNGLVMRSESTVIRLTDEDAILDTVKLLLPPQPWPKGISHEIAEKLDKPKRIITKAINSLIERGDFKHQVGGKLYLNAEEAERALQKLNEKPSDATESSA